MFVGWPSGLRQDLVFNRSGVRTPAWKSNFLLNLPLFPNFKGNFPAWAKLGDRWTLPIIIYMLQRATRAKSHPRAPTCSLCHFSMENCNI